MEIYRASQRGPVAPTSMREGLRARARGPRACAGSVPSAVGAKGPKGGGGAPARERTQPRRGPIDSRGSGGPGTARGVRKVSFSERRDKKKGPRFDGQRTLWGRLRVVRSKLVVASGAGARQSPQQPRCWCCPTSSRHEEVDERSCRQARAGQLGSGRGGGSATATCAHERGH